MRDRFGQNAARSLSERDDLCPAERLEFFLDQPENLFRSFYLKHVYTSAMIFPRSR